MVGRGTGRVENEILMLFSYNRRICGDVIALTLSEISQLVPRK